MSQPPSGGPRIGPTITPMPHIAIAAPCFSRGYTSSKVDCDSGTSDAPNKPCNRRKPTISPIVVAMPHSTEAIVNPAIAISSRRRRPMIEASQPVAGVAMAAATIYEVSTHEIWSCVADSEPCMFGSATFAIVVSSACIKVASITETTSRPRLGTSRWVGILAFIGVCRAVPLSPAFRRACSREA